MPDQELTLAFYGAAVRRWPRTTITVTRYPRLPVRVSSAGTISGTGRERIISPGSVGSFFRRRSALQQRGRCPRVYRLFEKQTEKTACHRRVVVRGPDDRGDYARFANLARYRAKPVCVAVRGVNWRKNWTANSTGYLSIRGISLAKRTRFGSPTRASTWPMKSPVGW